MEVCHHFGPKYFSHSETKLKYIYIISFNYTNEMPGALSLLQKHDIFTRKNMTCYLHMQRSLLLWLKNKLRLLKQNNIKVK